MRFLDGINLTLNRKTTLGLVGESGCGKSIMAMSVMGLIQSPPGKIVDGEINLHRKGAQEVVDLVKLEQYGAEMRDIRGREIAMVFQEPMTSLNRSTQLGIKLQSGRLIERSDVKKPSIAPWKCSIKYRSALQAAPERVPAPAKWGHAPAGDDCPGALV